jgi:Golgi phosphoprotein 3 (GPP34)
VDDHSSDNLRYLFHWAGAMQNFRLADEFFLVNHDHRTGKPAIRRDLLGAGLVTALLAELIIDGRLAMDDGRVTVLDCSSHGDQATDFMVSSIAAQQATYPVRTWTENLDDTAYELTARRLIECGTVRRVRPRRLMGPRRDLFPAAMCAPVESLLRLNAVIKNPAGADIHGAVSVVLIATVGATHVLVTDLDRERVRTSVTELANGLPADLKELVVGFEAAVATRLLSIRR